MADTKEQIIWLDMQDAGFRLFIDDQDRMVLDEINKPAPEATRQSLINMGFKETQSGFAGQYTALIAYGLSKIPGAKLIEMDREKTNIGYREILLENTQAFVQELIDNPEPGPAAEDEQEIDDFLDTLAGDDTEDVSQEPELPAENESEDQTSDPVSQLNVNDVALFKPYSPNIKTDIGMVTEVLRNTQGNIGYHVLVKTPDADFWTQRLWESDYDIQIIDTGFSWDTPNGPGEIIKKEGEPSKGFVFHVSSGNQNGHEVIKAEDIGVIIQQDIIAFENQKDVPDHQGTDEKPADEANFDNFINDIPEPRKSRIVSALSTIDTDTGLPRGAVIENYISQGFSVTTNEENGRKKRGLISPDGQFMEGFSKTELDYAGYLSSLKNTLSDPPSADSADLNSLREKARALGLEKEADILWLNKDASGLEKLISEHSKPVAPKSPEEPWKPGEQYRILDEISFQTPAQRESLEKTLGEKVMLNDYPGFEFVVHPDKDDNRVFVLSEYKTGMRIHTASYPRDENDPAAKDDAIQGGLKALQKNAPDVKAFEQLINAVDHINVAPGDVTESVIIAQSDNQDDPEENPIHESDPGYDLTEITFKDIDQISAQELLDLIHIEDIESQGYKLTMGDLMAEVSRRMKAGTLLKDLGWPEEPDAIYVNRQTGEKREFQILGHGYTFFEKYYPEGMESAPAEESQDEPQLSFDDKKQELRREYSDRGYALYYKVSDESWNLTNKQTRMVGETEFMAGDIALSLEKESFFEIDACIARFESLFSEQQEQADEGEQESVADTQVPDFSNFDDDMHNKRFNLPFNESLWYTVSKSLDQVYTVTIGLHDDSSISRVFGEGDTIEAAYNRAVASLKPELRPKPQPAEATEPIPSASLSEIATNVAILPYKEQFGSGAAKNIGKLINDLGIAQDIVDKDDYYARIENGEYMDLIIEKHSDELFLTHYYEQNGDLIMDNELVFKVNEPTGHLIFKEVALQNPKGGEIRTYDKGFANMFAKNLVKQGFGQGKIFHTMMSAANRLKDEQENEGWQDLSGNQEDSGSNRWQDYAPGQLPYYELGGKVLSVEDIEPYPYQKDEDGKVSLTNFFPDKAPTDPQVLLEKLMRYKATEEKNLEHYASKYKDVGERGIEAVSEEDRRDLSDNKAVATALFLEHSHIAYSKGYLAAIDAIVQERGLQQKLSDTQQENVAASPEKFAVTNKSVDGNPQRAVLKDGEIEILNKSGRKIVGRKAFPLAIWESLSQSFGNQAYNKREFVESLGIITVDGSPEADSLKERILDSQVSAIDSVYNEFKASQASQEVVEEKPVDNTLPDGWSESPNGGMITSKDPISGGIIDREIALGEWFVIPENDQIKKLEGFDTRAEAYNALMSQVNNLSKVVKDFDPTTPENYAKVMSDTELQDDYQDVLDSFFNRRIIDVRNALRDLGWEGEKYKDLFKHGESLKVTPIPTESGTNLFGYTINGVRDDLTLTPEQLAKKVDEAHNACFNEDKNMIGINQEGIEIHQADNGNRYLLKNGVKTSAPMALSPDRTMKAYSPEEHFENGRVQFLTSEEIESLAKPAKVNFPSVDEIPANTSMFFTGDEINLRRVLMTGGLPNDPEKMISLIEKKKSLTEKSFEADITKFEQLLSSPEPNKVVLDQLKNNISESKGRIEVLYRALDEQNQLLDEQQTMTM